MNLNHIRFNLRSGVVSAKDPLLIMELNTSVCFCMAVSALAFISSQFIKPVIKVATYSLNLFVKIERVSQFVCLAQIHLFLV